MRSLLFFLSLLTIFYLHPLLAFVVTWIVLFNSRLNGSEIIICLIILSAFWGILAFTQKSLTDYNTDAIRYYNSVSLYTNMSVKEALASIPIQDMMHYSFAPVNAIIVSITGNVQSLSFIWVFVSYIFFYLSVRRLMIIYHCYSQKRLASLLLLLTFGFVLFVQVTELLKQASAFAVFFYGFTLYLESGINFKIIIILLFAIGLHPSVFMLTPLFLNNVVSTKKLFIVTAILAPILTFVDISDIIFTHLPGGEYFSMLNEHYGGGGESNSATPHYIAIELLMLYISYDLWRREKYKNDSSINVVLLYFLVSFANYNNLVAFLRFALFSHWIFSLILIKYSELSFPKFKFSRAARIVIILMFVLTTRFTLSRLGMGIYPSSYMDNSIVKLVSSSLPDYLNVKYDR